jgi:hypothetical protein
VTWVKAAGARNLDNATLVNEQVGAKNPTSLPLKNTGTGYCL